MAAGAQWSVLEQIFGAGRYAPGTYSPRQAYALSPYVAPSVHAFASVVAARTFQVKRGTKPLESHGLLNLIARPNADLRTSEYELLYYSAALHRQAGEVFWECEYGNDPVRPGRKRHAEALPTKIWIWHRDAVQLALNYQNRREWLGWDVTWEGAKHFVDRLDMLHFPVYDPTQHNPKGPARGTSVWESKRLPLTNEIAASRWNSDWWSRGVAPSVAFINKSGDAIEPGREEEFRDKLKAKLAGKNGEPIALTGDWVIQQLEATQREAQFTEGQDQNRKAILAGIAPPIVLGDNEANYANANAQIKAWLTFDVIPAMTFFCSRIDAAFLYDQPELWTNLSTDDIDELQADKQARINAYVSLINNRHTPKVAAEITGLNVDPEMPGFDEVFLSFSQIPYPIAQAGGSVSVSKEDAPEPGLAVTDAPVSPAPTIQQSEPQRSFRILMPNDEPPVSPVVRIAPVATRAADKDDLFSLIFKIVQKDAKKIRDKAAPFQLQAVELGTGQIAKALGSESVLAIDNPKIVKFLEERGNLITSVPEGVAERISSKAVSLIEQGTSPENIGTILKKDFNDLTSYKAREIARNEVGSGLSGGRFLQMEEEGVDSHDWLSARKPNTRDDHASEDGNTVTVGDEFPVTKLRYPQDPEGPPEQTINCQCLTLPAVGGSRAVQCAAHLRMIATPQLVAAEIEAAGGQIDAREAQRRIYWRATALAQDVRTTERRMTEVVKSIIHGWRAPILKALADQGVVK